MAQTLNSETGLPAFVVVKGTPRFSANQLRTLAAVTGMPMDRVMNDPANVMQAFAWFELRKEGYEPSWEQAGDVPIEFENETPDPT
jgi:hypothetical protein